MTFHPSWSVLIPAPAQCIPKEGIILPLARLDAVEAEPEFLECAQELCRDVRSLDLHWETGGSSSRCPVRLLHDSEISSDGWRMDVAEEGITVSAKTVSGMRYAREALEQMLFAAAVKGGKDNFLSGVDIRDEPRFAWRGFHLDSARHFQPAETVRRILALLAAFRINTFHWHLADCEGWRYPSQVVPELSPQGLNSSGQYSPGELRGIAEYAEKLGIAIVPELDVPGHSAMLLKNRPRYACDERNPGNEFCIGNPETMTFLERLFDELMDLFPHSKIIHIGGDEAETAGWDHCPKCKQACADKGFGNMRQLENDFMARLAHFILGRGRRPMIWGTCSGQTYPEETVIQSWLDIREPLRVAPHGNKVVYSVHTSLYFDYPADLSEPWESWMFELSERGVYMTDPHVIWAEAVKDIILGTEACLWTETVPHWRVFSKIFPRLPAYAECAWSMPEKKDYADFSRRKALLNAAGYFDFLSGRKPF